MPAKKSDPDKVFDVAKPGTSTPDIGSKPMIVGHKSMASDPMVRESTEEYEPEDHAVTGVPKVQASKFKIVPLTDMDDDSETGALDKTPEIKPKVAAASKGQTKDATVYVNAEAEDAAKKSESDVKEEPTTEAAEDNSTQEFESTEATLVASNADEAAESEPKINETDQSNKEAKSEEKQAVVDPAVIASERDENLKKIIESKKYRLNIKETNERSNKNTIIAALLIIVVALAGLYALADLGKLSVGFEVPYHLLGKKQSPVNTNTSQPSSEQSANATSKAKDQTLAMPPTSQVPKYKAELDYPASWKHSSVAEDLTANQFATEFYTLPSGTELVQVLPPGGRGGDCVPKETDVPGAAGNTCPTEEILTSDPLSLDAETLNATGNMKVYLQHIKFTSTDGKTSYATCLYKQYAEKEPVVGVPQMGLYSPDCAASQLGDMKITGPPNDSPDFFDNPDVKAIEAVLRTYKLKKTS